MRRPVRARKEDRMPVPDFRRWPCLLAVVVACASLLAACAMVAPTPKRATALLAPVDGGSARGTVTFIEIAEGVQVTYRIKGLPPGAGHVLHVRERGDCLPEAGSAADVLNPDNAPVTRAAGVMPGIRADANGVATGFVVVPALALDGIRSVVGHAVSIHRDADDAGTDTIHGAPMLACGVAGR
jgi:Cu-Zn family superoxide dismutase